jgi:hypothetical protein
MSSQDKKNEKEAADSLAAPFAALPPISDVKKEGNPAVEVEAADSLLVRSHATPFLLSHLYFGSIDHYSFR